MKKKYNNIIISKRYAKALFYYSIELGESDLVYNDLIKLENLIYKIDNLDLLIKNPLIINKKKIEIIIELLNFSSKISLQLIELIIQNNRELIIKLIIIEYKKIYHYKNKIYIIKLITPIYFDINFQKQIINKILYKINQNYQYKIDNKINNEIIGGFCIYIEEKKLDFTIKKLIFDIKNNFIN